MASATHEKQSTTDQVTSKDKSTTTPAGTLSGTDQAAPSVSSDPAAHTSPAGTRKSSKKSKPSSPSQSPSATLSKPNPSSGNGASTGRTGSNGQQQQPSTTTSNGAPNGDQTTPKKPKRSFWKGFRSFLLPCIPSFDSHKAHDLDIDSSKTATSGTAGQEATGEEKTVDEKAAAPTTTGKAETDVPPVPHAKSPTSTSGTGKVDAQPPATPSKSKPAAPSPLTVPAAPIENDGDVVVVPPSPHSHLLPREETEGVTSGAVQPPGGTGADVSITDDNEGDVADNEAGQAHGLAGEMDVEDEDDEEERLILAGGTGIPIGADGKPCPLLPPLAPAHKGRKCLILDLDETLLHSSFKLIPQADYVVPVEIEWQWHNVYVIKRPGVDNFLKQMGELYEVVIFTASLSKYADPVLDKLDVHKVVAHRLFRESCYQHKGSYVKDLSRLGRPVEDMIILDNSPASYIFHPNNAVPVSSWFNDPHDTELTDLCPFLGDLMHAEDVRGVLDGGL